MYDNGDEEMELLNLSDLARKLSVTRQTIYRWVDLGCPVEFKAYKTIRFKYEDVIEWLNQSDKGTDTND